MSKSSAPKKETERRDIRQEVTDSIMRKLEEGTMPWRRGWEDAEQQRPMLLPRNGESGKMYRGGNRLSLLSVMHGHDYSDPRFFTFKQLQAHEAGPEKGSKGYPVEYWDKMPFWKRRDCQVMVGGNPVQVHDVRQEGSQTIATIGPDRRDVHAVHLDAKGPDGRTMRWRQAERELDVLYARHSVVFNVAQCRGLERYLEANPLDIPKRTEVQLDRALDGIVHGMEATGLRVRFEEQNRAFYRPSSDMIMMPAPKQFQDAREFRSTLLHELGHATGHESRLAREGIVSGDGFGGPKYAREELVAELTSAFMSAETGIDRVDDQHAAYIGVWLEALKSKDGKHVLFEAAREADKASDYLLGRSLERGKSVEQDQEQGAAPAKKAKETADLER